MNGDIFSLAPQAYVTCKGTSIITCNHFDQNIILWKYLVLKVTFYDKRNNLAAFNLETKWTDINRVTLSVAKHDRSNRRQCPQPFMLLYVLHTL